MTTHPSAAELLQAVIAWLDAGAKSNSAPERETYMALVARNALGIVLREWQQGPQADAAAQARLVKLLSLEGDLATLEAELTSRIRAGIIAPGDPALLNHLRLQTASRLAIDQPRYRGTP